MQVSRDIMEGGVNGVYHPNIIFNTLKTFENMFIYNPHIKIVMHATAY